MHFLNMYACPVVYRKAVFLTLFSFIYTNDMSQAVKCNLFPYADGKSHVCHHKDINEIEKKLNKDFESLYGWFAEHKLSIHFGDYKTKSTLFAAKFKIKKVRKLNTEHLYAEYLQSNITYCGQVWVILP